MALPFLKGTVYNMRLRHHVNGVPSPHSFMGNTSKNGSRVKATSRGLMPLFLASFGIWKIGC